MPRPKQKVEVQLERELKTTLADLQLLKHRARALRKATRAFKLPTMRRRTTSKD